jgi:hypothetical protein
MTEASHSEAKLRRPKILVSVFHYITTGTARGRLLRTSTERYESGSVPVDMVTVLMLCRNVEFHAIRYVM